MPSDALKQAYVRGTPALIHCLELLHDSFDAPLRITNSREDQTVTHEASAPEDPSTAVSYSAVPFSLVLLKIEDNPEQGIEIRVSNIDKAASDLLDIAVDNPTPITAIYRLYVAGDTSAPAQDPPDTLSIHSAVANKRELVAHARSYDVINRKFPNIYYDAENFPALLLS